MPVRSGMSLKGLRHSAACGSSRSQRDVCLGGRTGAELPLAARVGTGSAFRVHEPCHLLRMQRMYYARLCASVRGSHPLSRSAQ